MTTEMPECEDANGIDLQAFKSESMEARSWRQPSTAAGNRHRRLKLFPKRGQLFGPEIRQHPPVHVNHRRQFLAGQVDHFVISRFVTNHVNGFIFDTVLIQPLRRAMTPWTIGFDE